MKFLAGLHVSDDILSHGKNMRKHIYTQKFRWLVRGEEGGGGSSGLRPLTLLIKNSFTPSPPLIPSIPLFMLAHKPPYSAEGKLL